jgi:hypothetical protein
MKRLALALGVGVLLVAVGMAGVSAWQRAASGIDRVLMVALAAFVVAAVHLLPSLTKSRAVWPLWGLCLVVAIHGHAGFLMNAGEQAAATQQERQSNTKALALDAQQNALQVALDGTKSRPVSVVAALLARDQSPEKRQALQVELLESQNAVALRTELVTLAKTRAIEASHGDHVVVTDPITKGISSVTGMSHQSVTLLISMVTAALLEIVGMVLWRVALRPEPVRVAAHAVITPPEPEPVANLPEPVTTTTPTPTDTIQFLRDAVAMGDIKPTVTGIRRYLGCSQSRASEVRRSLVTMT